MIKTEFSGYVKDDTPGQAKAILNIDNASFAAYKDARNKDKAIQTVVREMDDLKQDVAVIKELLLKLTNGNK